MRSTGMREALSPDMMVGHRGTEMGKDTMIETKRKDLVVPWLLIVIGLVAIFIVIMYFFAVESTRWYSNPGSTSTAVLILGAIISAPILFIGIYYVGRNTRFNDRIDEISLSMKLEEINRSDRPINASMSLQPDPTRSYCPDCGNSTEGRKFCKYCGAKVG